MLFGIRPACDKVRQIPLRPSERSRWRGGCYARHTTPVKPQRGVLIPRFRFRVISATVFDSKDYSLKSIEIPWGRLRRNRQRFPSSGFVKSAPEHRASARLILKCALTIKL